MKCSFSAMSLIKTKHRNRLSVQIDLIIAVNDIEPRFDNIFSKKAASSFSLILYVHLSTVIMDNKSRVFENLILVKKKVKQRFSRKGYANFLGLD